MKTLPEHLISACWSMEVEHLRADNDSLYRELERLSLENASLRRQLGTTTAHAATPEAAAEPFPPPKASPEAEREATEVLAADAADSPGVGAAKVVEIETEAAKIDDE